MIVFAILHIFYLQKDLGSLNPTLRTVPSLIWGQVELNYAELGWTDPNSRLFDVIIEGKLVTPALDVAGEVGGFAALATSQFVAVEDGQLNVRFVSRTGAPILNGIRVTQRPDRTTP